MEWLPPLVVTLTGKRNITVELESTIPEWLRTDRTVPPKTPAGFTPPFDVYTSRYPETTKGIAMAIFGVQCASASLNDGVGLKTISSFISSDLVDPSSQPAFHEVAAARDNSRFRNVPLFTYWPSTGPYKAWSTKSGFNTWWSRLDLGGEGKNGHGWFLEVFMPTVDQFETVFTTAAPEGCAHIGSSISGPIKEHNELLKNRDDQKSGKEHIGSGTELPTRVRVPGKKNLTFNRSGQDWSAALTEERQLYLDSMQPPLIRGMEYLRDHGDEEGCFSCRFTEIVDPITGKVEGSGTDRTFGLAYFDHLASLERWSREHRTYLAIFGRFSKYAKRLGDQMSLALFHEVLVLEPEQQSFEYIGCHGGTAMLRSLQVTLLFLR